jgi:hypothetical protein
LERRLTTKSFEEPFFELYDEEEDIDLNLLEIWSEDWAATPEDEKGKEDEDTSTKKDTPAKDD